MADTIVLYATPENLNTTLLLAKFISKHYPSISVVIISTAAASSAATVPSITYHHVLPTPTLPPNFTTNHVELLFEISRLNNPNLHQALQEISHKSKIKAFVMDFFCNPAFEVSRSLNLPTYFYVSSGAFALCVFLYFPTIHETMHENIRDLKDFIHIPGCPPIFSLDFPENILIRQTNTYKHLLDVEINMRKSNGIIVNSFDVLEFRAKEALSNEKNSQNGAAEHECVRWLDSQPSDSIIFLCFGRRGLFSAEQLKEIAIGLENSGHRFLWSVRGPPGKRDLAVDDEADLDELLPEGFLERTKERGFIIKSWAPQKEVLSHDSVGGFLTHCGRSSVLEALSFGVPMIGWPLYADQRMNRVFMVEEMKVALPLEESEGGFVTAVELEKRVRELMDSQMGRAVRHRVGELKVAAEAAVRKNGSSVTALEKFVKLVARD
ncbi:hypothetical protein BUALT_Bualt06G0101500 [Buddleja alternifolia]|uniref:Glycosyltransferase n=1 Tax=Buddleja alternifolia TaxID=168488 RepID=A0AAV6XDS1_9LAMI|nr:hypothetical protein BUALT_Bualt06G0101500 [Buddleja alternifolia]